MQRRIIRAQKMEYNLGQSSKFDSEVLPSSVVDIAPILRVANEIDYINPRVAYLCRFYALKKVHSLDPTLSGSGVRQFRTALQLRLEKDNDPTLIGRVKDSDAHEMQSFYQHYYKEYVEALHNAADKASHAQLTKVHQTASILFEVLKAIYQMQFEEVDDEILEVYDKVAEKTELYVPYNIIPLDPDSAMRYPEIQSVIYALRNTKGLPWPKDYKKKHEDILDWLQIMFGFQKDNVANQREHLILLLANVHMRRFPNSDQQSELDDRTLDEVMKKLLKNYKKWCKFLDRKSSLWLPTIQQEMQQRKLLYTALYLLIWGEAANLRFMPECLCYIYHHMGFELYSMLSSNVNPMTGETVKPAYGGEEEAFLRKVITPIYDVIAREAARCKVQNATHSQWRNYDDLNEYFWSTDCFHLGWPMRADADFFCLPQEQLRFEKNGDNKPSRDQWVGKVNFVEIRSFWHIFRSFDRMWSFFILCLQAMILVAWNGPGHPSSIFHADVFKKVLSVFITAAILQLGQAVLDVILSWKARQSMSFHVRLRYILKLLSAATWVIILSVTYCYTWENPSGFAQTIKSWFGNSSSCPSLFILAVIIYLSPKMLAAILVLFPFIHRSLERSNYKIIMLMMWWSQPQLYIGRGAYESTFSLFKYSLFWILLIMTKLAFSYYVQIRPIVGSTKAARSNIGVVITLWAPITLVYFMDTQIWYSIFSTLLGGIYGAFCHLGEIQTLGMLRSRFDSFPDAFNACLIPEENNDPSNKRGLVATSSNGFKQIPCSKDKKAARFAQLWNTIITSLREEDLISDREMGLLLVPYWADHDLENIMQWPPFLLAGQIPLAVYVANDNNGNDSELKNRMDSDPYMSSSVRECYASFQNIINFLVRGAHEKKVIGYIFSEVDKHIEAGDLITKYKMSALPMLYELFVKLIKILLENNQEDRDLVLIILQDMVEVVIRDIMMENHTSSLVGSIHEGLGHEGINPLDEQYPLFASAGAIQFPTPESEAWKEKIKRLHLLLTMKESAAEVPSNSEARRRISFFSNSLFMDMPPAPKVRNMLSFSALTPYYAEEVLFPLHVLEMPNEDGVSILLYMQKNFPDEWNNFLERMKCNSEEELKESDDMEEELRLWASYRGQTLTRAVRGMMYYRKALELQAFLDMANDEDLMKGYKAIDINEDQMEGKRSLWDQCQAVGDMKFTCVLSCHLYGSQKRSGDQRSQDILRLMTVHPSLRVAYIDELEEPSKDRSKNVTHKVYYSTLVKAVMLRSSSEPWKNLDQVIYRIKLPGPAILGEGKPENLNHAAIFTRGEGLQLIDMNQDNYMEEALKMRNLLQEFLKRHNGIKQPTILGLRDHVFTESSSSLGWFILSLETSFVTIAQRLLANPLKVRFRCGHSNVFDRIFHLTRGGVGKASKDMNMNEDIFAGLNSTLREGCVTYHEYIQIGKGRDVGLKQNYFFEAKIAKGNGELTLSRDLYRLGQLSDFFRMLSCYFTTIGFYFSSLITVLTVYVFLYGRLYLIFTGLEEKLRMQPGILDNKALHVVLASQSFVQLGFLMALPMMMEIVLQRGFLTALSEFILMQLQLAPVLFAFQLGTKTHYYGRTILHGGAPHWSVGRGFVPFHVKFVDNYCIYSRSHFVKGLELMILLVVYQVYGQSYKADAYGLWSIFGFLLPSSSITVSIWFMVFTWLFAPFLFSSSGFEWENIASDWKEWNKWISNRGGIGVPSQKSWESWWEKEQEHLLHTGKCGIVAEIILASRFFIFQYGLIYHLNKTKNATSLLAYGAPWLMIFLILFAMKTIFVGQRKFRANFQLMFRLFKGMLFLFCILITLIAFLHMTPRDILFYVIAFMASGWGFILIAQACKPVFVKFGLWGTVRTLARGYEIVMGLFLFVCNCFSGSISLWMPNLNVFQPSVERRSSAFLYSRRA